MTETKTDALTDTQTLVLNTVRAQDEARTEDEIVRLYQGSVPATPGAEELTEPTIKKALGELVTKKLVKREKANTAAAQGDDKENVYSAVDTGESTSE